MRHTSREHASTLRVVYWPGRRGKKVDMSGSRYCLTILAVCTACVISACIFGSDDNKETSDREPAEYLPLAPGNYWRLTAIQGTYVRWLVGDANTIDGVEWYDMTLRTTVGGNEITSIPGRLAHDGDSVRIDLDGTLGVLLKKPLETNTSWIDGRGTNRIIEIGVSVTTPAGVFEDVIAVETETPLTTETYFYAPGVGPVQAVIQSDYGTFTFKLETYGTG